MTKATLHRVHGEWLSIADAAERLGVSRDVLYWYCCKYKRTLEEAYDHYRERNAKGLRKFRLEERHCVHGEWLTTTEAAARLGVARRTLVNYRCKHKCLLEDAFDHFDGLNKGWIVRGKTGPKPRRGWVKGKYLTIREEACALGVSLSTMYRLVQREGSIAGAVRAIEKKREDAAVREIVKPLQGGRPGKARADQKGRRRK